MKKIQIKNLQNTATHSAQFGTQELADAWISECVQSNAWGKPERWVKAEDEDISNALEQRVIHNEFETYTEYKMQAEYAVEIIDITAEVEAEKAIKAAKKAKFEDLITLKGKSLSAAEVKKAVELLIELWPFVN